MLDTLDSWGARLATYQFWITMSGAKEETKSKTRSDMKHKVDVCSAELEKTLKAGVAPEKSECYELLNPKPK